MEMPYKKSQLQIGEIVAVLVVFFVITIIGFVVYFNVLRGEVEDQTEEFRDIGSIGVVQNFLALPELQCSENNVVKENCVDMVKLKISSNCGKLWCEEEIKKDSAGYFDLFGFSKIVVKQVYPSPDEWVVYDNPIYQPSTAEAPGLKTNVPIILFDPIDKRNNFGVLEVTSYIR